LVTASLHPAIHFFPVSHPHHEDYEDLVPNLVDNAVVLPRPDIDAVELLFRFQLFDPMRTRILRIKLAKVPFSSGSDFHAVGQNLVSKFPHEVAQRNGPLLLGFFQGGAGIFEIHSVHFFPGQSLQEAEVIHRDDGGQVLPTAGDNGPLFPIGGAVYDFGKLFSRFRDIEACHDGVPFVQIVRVN